jgi:type IV secretory pathway component VirB8
MHKNKADSVDLTGAIADEIESGAYFAEARDWYGRIYIAPIAQRVFYLIITVICVLIFFFAFSAITNLLPIVETRPFFYLTTANDMMDRRLRIVPLREPTEPVNQAMRRFYLTQFVSHYEAYDEGQFDLRRKFIYQHAAADVFSTYDQQISPANRNSPIRRFGKFASVDVDVQSVQLLEKTNPPQAIVYFAKNTTWQTEREQDYWTARITYDWSDLKENNRWDDTAGDYVLELTEAAFKVQRYQIQPQQR